MILVNVIVIYGSSNETSTYNCVQLLLNNLRLNVNIKVTEFFLLENDFYNGYPSYSNISSKTCDDIRYITDSLDNADLFVLASSVFKCDISIEMKMLLDKLSYRYMSDSTRSLMNNKIGLSISTAAGAGLSHTTKILKRNFNSFGIKNTLKFSKTLYEMNWEYVSLKTKMKINREIFKLSYKILDLYNHTYNIKPSAFRKISLSKKKDVLINDNSNVIELNSWKYQPHLHSRHIQ
jgi:multimeric flavodoxin WrbA